jgi:hypothetical protein
MANAYQREDESPCCIAPAETRSPRILIVTPANRPDSLVDDVRKRTPEADYVTATEDQIYERAESVDAIIGCPGSALTDASSTALARDYDGFMLA